jgi:hypothetical protein
MARGVEFSETADRVEQLDLIRSGQRADARTGRALAPSEERARRKRHAVLSRLS